MSLLPETLPVDRLIEVKLVSPEQGISFELQRKIEELENLINNGNRIYKLTGEKIVELYNTAVNVDRYSPKRAAKFLKDLLCQQGKEIISLRHLRRLVPEEAKDTSKKNLYINHDADICPHNSLNTSNTIELKTPHIIQDAEIEEEEEPTQDSLEIKTSFQKAKNIVNEVYPQELKQEVEDGYVIQTKDEVKELQQKLKEKDKEIKRLNAEIKELNIRLQEKRQREIIHFNKDIEYLEDKILPIKATCYVGGKSEDHIILLDIDKIRELKRRQQ